MDLQVLGVTYRYPGRSAPALREVTLEIAPGECVGVIGANAAGKTSLCNLFLGFIPHFYRGEFSGRVLVQGRDTLTTTPGELASLVGYVFQEPAQQLSGVATTVYEEVAFGLENLGLERHLIRQRVEETIEHLGIAELADRSPWELSGGQQQRVSLASVLAMRPCILVLDEPTSQLDPAGTDEVFDTVVKLSRQGMTIVLVEHKLDLLASVASRIILMAEGQVVLDDRAERVLPSPMLERYGLEPPLAVRLVDRLGLESVLLTLDEAALMLGEQRP